jgi:hypothetical protein
MVEAYDAAEEATAVQGGTYLPHPQFATHLVSFLGFSGIMGMRFAFGIKKKYQGIGGVLDGLGFPNTRGPSVELR